MELAPSSVRAVQRIPFTALGGFSKLFGDYTSGSGTAGKYYKHPPTLKGVALAADQARDAVHAHRDVLVQVLEDQHSGWGQDAGALANIQRLRQPDASVVITGQQVGLFTGPTYSVLKAMTTVILARKLEAETGKPVVPVFWLGSEDHDLEEMASTWIPGPEGPVRLHYSGHTTPQEGNLGPVGALEFTADLDTVIETMESTLPSTEFLPEVMDAVRRWYVPGHSFCDAFAGLMREFLPDSGLVLFSAHDPRIKPLAAPLWKREVLDWETADEHLRAASSSLESTYHAQVHIRPTNLFLSHKGMRLPIDADGESFSARGTGLVWSRDQLAQLLDSSPELFSPNVVLRPLTQDWLFPTAAYVAGPGEAAYFAQYRSVYDWADIPMPVIYPRVSASFIEPGIRRTLDRLGIPVGEFRQDGDALFAKTARARMEFDAGARFDELAGKADALVAELAPDVASVDQSLGRTLDSTRAAIQKEINRLRDRVLKADRRNQDQLRKQIDKVQGALFPNGTPQERLISPVYLASKYGMNFFANLLEDLDEDTRSHLLLDV